MSTTSIIINGRRYAVDVLSPLEALEWTPRLMASGFLNMAEGDSFNHKEVSTLAREATKRCWTPDNRKLEDDGVFTEWFAKHPEDLLQLGMQAAVEVCRDFLPSIGGTTGKKSPQPGKTAAV